jgi:hypothetical protein
MLLINTVRTIKARDEQSSNVKSTQKQPSPHLPTSLRSSIEEERVRISTKHRISSQPLPSHRTRLWKQVAQTKQTVTTKKAKVSIDLIL